jgi:hypothetical protein
MKFSVESAVLRAAFCGILISTSRRVIALFDLANEETIS